MTNYMEKALRTCSPGYHKDLVAPGVLHGAIGIVTEAGELLDALKKALFYGKPVDETNIIEELGDILWYMQPILKHYGITEEQVKERNIAKLAKRYPEKFTTEQATTRDLAAEREALHVQVSGRAERSPLDVADQERQRLAIKAVKSNADEPTY